jgi:hypothetical protein
MIKFNQRILLIILSIFVCILELTLLVNLFPQTGLSRIVYIPFWIIIVFFIALLLTKNKKSLKKVLINLIVAHLILFHLMIWSWPQSSAIQKNLVKEFYQMVCT